MGRKSKQADDRYFIGVGNGISGSIGVIGPKGYSIFILPKEYTKKEQDYTKKKGNITRIDHKKLYYILYAIFNERSTVYAMVERPMVNPGKMKASYSALRSLEATLVILEQLEVSVTYLASTDWSRSLLPNGVKGPALKKASLDIATRLFPQFKDLFIKQKDGDGMLIAEHCRRTFK